MEIGGDRLKKKEDETGKRKHVPSTVYVGRDPFFSLRRPFFFFLGTSSTRWKGGA